MTKKTDKRTPTTKDWEVLRNLFLRGETLDDIIKTQPNIKWNKKSIMTKFGSDGTLAIKRAIHEESLLGLKRSIIIEKKETNDACARLFSTGADVIEKLLKQYQEEADDPNIPKTRAKATAYNIDLLMSGVTKIQKGLRVAYNMDADGKLVETEPEITVVNNLNINKI